MAEQDTGQQAPGGDPAAAAAAALLTLPTNAEHPAGGATDGVALPWAEAGDKLWTLGDKPWYEGVPEPEARELMKVKGYKNPNEVALAYWNANKALNGAPDVLTLPPADATPEQINAYYDKRGRPKEASEYKFEYPEGFKPDPKMEEFGRKMFHKIGLTNAEANVAAAEWNAYMAEYEGTTTDEFNRQNDEDMAKLEALHGDSMPEYLAAGRRVAQAAGLSAATIEKVEASIGTAGVVELLCAIGSKSKEGGFIGGDGGNPPTADQMTPAQAQEEINKNRADPVFQEAYTNANHPRHGEAVKKMQELYKRV